MSDKKRSRILNGKKYLEPFLEENEKFHIGLLFEDFVTAPKLSSYGFSEKFDDGGKVTPNAIGSSTKANLKGKFVRKQPEEKIDKKVHIKYRRKDGTPVAYDRVYHVYVKELLHKHDIAFEYRTNIHGQEVVVSQELTNSNNPSDIYKNTHVINMFLEICGDFEVFTTSYEPAIHFNKRFDQQLLPRGILTKESTQEILETTGRYFRNNEEEKAFQKRLHVLSKFSPDIRGKGPMGFFGYIVFGFSELGIVLLETMYSNNATYVFKLEDYEANIIVDKQKAVKDKKVIKRIYHYDDWDDRVETYLGGLKKKSGNNSE